MSRAVQQLGLQYRKLISHVGIQQTQCGILRYALRQKSSEKRRYGTLQYTIAAHGRGWA